jgi:hypothetical protein
LVRISVSHGNSGPCEWIWSENGMIEKNDESGKNSTEDLMARKWRRYVCWYSREFNRIKRFASQEFRVWCRGQSWPHSSPTAGFTESIWHLIWQYSRLECKRNDHRAEELWRVQRLLQSDCSEGYNSWCISWNKSVFLTGELPTLAPVVESPTGNDGCVKLENDCEWIDQIALVAMSQIGKTAKGCKASTEIFDGRREAKWES